MYLKKIYKRKKSNDKGFTLVELIIVVAILAVLVGMLAPQYTKYVEETRKAADVSNMKKMVDALKIAFSDPDYADIFEDKAMRYVIRIRAEDGVQIFKGEVTAKQHENIKGQKNTVFLKALDEFVGEDWRDLKPTSRRWSKGIRAICDVYPDNTIQISYFPKEFAEAVGGPFADNGYGF